MKKLLFIGLAVTALFTACSNDESIDQPAAKAIAFDNAFVDNSTRIGSTGDPSTKLTNFTNFGVYGFMDNTGGTLFTNLEVTRDPETQICTYGKPSYWIAGKKYYFAAIAPSDNGNGATVTVEENGSIKTVISEFTNDGKTDLLYAPTVITDLSGKEAATLADPGSVKFTFKHILSKAKFTFVNDFASSNATIKVTNICITNAKKKAKATMAGEGCVWSDWASETMTLAFGNAVEDKSPSKDAGSIAQKAEYESFNEMLMIPATSAYEVTFTVNLFYGTASGGTYNLKTTIKSLELKPGYSYDFKATLNDTNIRPDNPQWPIEFSVTELTEWKDGTTIDPPFGPITNP